jgi:hypothetical protein
MEKTKPVDAVNELTLVLMYLNRFHDDGRKSLTNAERAWKGYDFAALDALDELDYIRQGSHGSKSVVLTQSGLSFAKALLEKYQIEES